MFSGGIERAIGIKWLKTYGGTLFSRTLYRTNCDYSEYRFTSFFSGS